METQNQSLGKSALQGAGIALILAIIFLSVFFSIGGVLAGKKFSQAIWEFFPLITVTAGGTLGGLLYYLMAQSWNPSGWKKVLATSLSILIYIVLLWLCLVIGFSATGQWD